MRKPPLTLRLLLPLLLSLPLVVSGQSLRGTVVLADSSTPARGVIVLATDAAGTAAARTLTGERGEFALSLPSAGRFALKVLRIGFRPTAVPPIAVGPGAPVSVRIVLNADAVSLGAVNVRARDECRVNPDSGLLVARVWDEARKALMTSQLIAGGAPLVADWITYDRTLDPSGRFVREQRVRSARNATTHAFRSAPADSLATNGYVREDSTGTTFYAPDADVLLSPSFADSHCLRLAATPRDRPGLVGVEFQPTRARGDVRDIAGTFWVDRASSELRTLDFTYTNVGDLASAAGAGGVVEFLRLRNGAWLVSRWSIRMPRVGRPDAVTDDGERRLVFSTSQGTVTAVQVTGGEVTRVTRNDSLLFAAVGDALALQVTSADTLVRASGAAVLLAGTDYAGTADSNGLAVISPVLAGRYVAQVRSSLMDSLRIAPSEREVVVGGAPHVDSVSLPGAREILRKLCPRDSVSHGEGMLRGTVRDEHGQPLKQAAVTVTWQGAFANVSDQLAWNEVTLGVLSDASGRWRLCGVPRDVVLWARVVSDSGRDERKVRLAEDQPFGAADLVAHDAAADVLGRPWTPRALVEFAVYGMGGAPLPGATLEVTAPGGSARTVVTGAGGRALVPDVAPGLLRVRARRIGFKPGQLAVTVAAGRNTVPILLSDAVAPALDTVRIMGDKRTNGRLDEFDTRHLRHEATASFDRADIEKANPVEAWQMLTRVPSIKLISAGNMLVPASNRGMVPDPHGTLTMVPCLMQVMVDGVMLAPDDSSGGFDAQRLPPPDQIYGIEVFAGASSVPLKYGGGSGTNRWCGLIAIWTR